MLYLVRHGESYFNRYGIKEPDPDLTHFGRIQCLKIKEYFKDIGLDVIYCSPLRRAIQTLENSGLYGEGVIISPLIREKKESACDFFHGEPWIQESDGEVRARCQSFLDSLKDRAANQKILVVSHSTCIKHLMALLGSPPRGQGNCEVMAFPN